MLVIGFKLDFSRNKPAEIPINMVFETIAEQRAAPKPKVKPRPKAEEAKPQPAQQEVVEPVQEPEMVVHKREEIKQKLPETSKPDPVENKPAPNLKKPKEPKKLSKQKVLKVKQKPAARPKAIKKLEDKKIQASEKQAFEDLLQEIDLESSNDQEVPEATNHADQITASEIDAVRQKIYRCWIVPAGARGAKDLKVDIEMQLRPDGTVYKADIVDTQRSRSDPFFRTAAESAQRAVLDPSCNPLPLNPSKYEQWKSITMTFNPEDMFKD